MLKLDIANLTPKLIKKIKEIDCVKSVAQEGETHLKVHATGDTPFDDILKVLQANNTKINSIEHVQPTLEDVFLQITGRDMRDKADNKMRTPRHGPNAMKKRIR